MKLGIDFGHGGRNSGCTFNEKGVILQEKNFTRMLGEELIHTLPWQLVDPVILRPEDETVSFESRGRTAANSGCHWVMSIHINASTKASQAGMEVYVPPNRLDCRLVAHTILEAAPGDLRTRRVFEAINKPDDPGDDWLERPKHVLDPYPSIPRILVEACYLSNEHDRAILTSPAGRMSITSALRAGVAKMIQIHKDS